MDDNIITNTYYVTIEWIPSKQDLPITEFNIYQNDQLIDST